MDETYRTFRVATTRATWHNYSGGWYFVTICTSNHQHHFGEITDSKMVLNQLGIYLNQQIINSPALRTNIKLDIPLFVIMPNHVHLVIILDNQCSIDRNIFGPQISNLSSVVRGIKNATTSYALKNKIPFKWQPRFHDHIIRTQEQCNLIANYIESNPTKWSTDKYNL